VPKTDLGFHVFWYLLLAFPYTPKKLHVYPEDDNNNKSNKREKSFRVQTKILGFLNERWQLVSFFFLLG